MCHVSRLCHVRSNYVANIAEGKAGTDFYNREKEVKMEKKSNYFLIWERYKKYAVRMEEMSLS